MKFFLTVAKTSTWAAVCLAVLNSNTSAAPKISPPAVATNIYESALPATAESKLDKIVFRELKKIGVSPVLCSDAVFVRRAYLDLIGTLPTAAEAREFINDPDTANKRQLLVDQLLEREEFADYWSMKWGDLLRIKAEFPVNLWPNAAQAYHRWVRASIVENKPYDEFARELLTSSGSNFRVGSVNFYRAVQTRTPEGIAATVALTLMGSRTDSWPQEKVQGMAAFFSQIGYKATREWKEENVYWDPLKTNPPAATEATNAAAQARQTVAAIPQFPDGRKVRLGADRDPREVFADWLIQPRNPFFTKAIVNRAWFWFMGRGIIHEPDDIRTDNPAANPALLAYLEKEMISGRYDMKRLFRLITTSKTYQLSSTPRYDHPKAPQLFATYGLRRVEAEVLIDSLNAITGTGDLYTSPIPEPFTYIPTNMPAIALADGSITSPFLSLFGRSARATGMENERPAKPVPAQWLHLLNSSHVQRKLEDGPRLPALFKSGREPQAILEELYLTILSRYPTEEEIIAAEAYGNFRAPFKPAARQVTFQKRREAWMDLAWALINTQEFLYRH